LPNDKECQYFMTQSGFCLLDDPMQCCFHLTISLNNSL
jgi:hypothetical protein